MFLLSVAMFFGQGFDQVGIEIDPHLEDRDQQVVAGRVGPVVHLQPFRAFGKRQNSLVRTDTNTPSVMMNETGSILNASGFGMKKFRIADDRILGFRIFGRTLDLLDLLTRL